LIEILLIRFAELAEVSPLPGDIGSSVENDDSLIQNMSRGEKDI
jgi:hypothetical protein